MTLLEWGAIGELISGVAIIISLFYVGAQIGQNTRATKVEVDNSFVGSYRDIVGHLIDKPEFREIYWRGLKGLSNLNGSETVAFAAWMIQAFRYLETFWYRWQDGMFDDRLWAGWQAQFRDLFGNVGTVEVWNIRKHQISDHIRDFVEKNIIGAASKPLYGPEKAVT